MTKQFNSLSEIADALEAGEITKDQALKITRHALPDRPVSAFYENGEMTGTPDDVAHNLRLIQGYINNGKGGLFLINLYDKPNEQDDNH